MEKMMKTAKALCVLLIAFLAAGCGARWVKLDDSAAESSRVEAAKAKCQVEDRLYNLRYQEIATEAAINSLSDEASREELRQGFQMKEQKVYEEINSCMAAQGLKSSS